MQITAAIHYSYINTVEKRDGEVGNVPRYVWNEGMGLGMIYGMWNEGMGLGMIYGMGNQGMGLGMIYGMRNEGMGLGIIYGCGIREWD